MKNILTKIENWILNTKLGHFLFVFILVVILLLILNIFINGVFISGTISGGLCAIYFALTDKNKRYW